MKNHFNIFDAASFERNGIRIIRYSIIGTIKKILRNLGGTSVSNSIVLEILLSNTWATIPKIICSRKHVT